MTERVRLLIVEDEALIGLDLATLLETAGYAVSGPAPDLAAAMRLAEEDRPDVAFVDLNLADGMTGPEVARRLRESFGVRSVFLTGNPEAVPGDGRADGLMRKPFSEDSIVEAANWLSLLARGGQPAARPKSVGSLPSS